MGCLKSITGTTGSQYAGVGLLRDPLSLLQTLAVGRLGMDQADEGGALRESDRLRALLEDMTHDGSPIDSHPDRLAAIAQGVPHSIRVLPAPYDEPLDQFNCVMHALGLIARLESPCTPLGRFLADTTFLRRLIDDGVLRGSKARSGAIVVWSTADAIKHVGLLVTESRAVSKWGIDHLCEHGLFEVPSSYGDRLSYYDPLDPEESIAQLGRIYGSR